MRPTPTLFASVDDYTDALVKSEVLLDSSGLASLLLIASLHGIAADAAKLTHQFGTEFFSSDQILLAAKSLGMTAKKALQDVARLDKAPLPAIAQDRDGGFFILGKVNATLAEEAVLTPTES